jgi:predicted nucleic acid-binding Zn ribbon protein
MAFNSLDHILGVLGNQTLGQKQRDYQQLVEAWAKAVGPKINQQTRVLAVERGVLTVATSSSAWAQTLMFERRRILQRLNLGRKEAIADIRFSPRDWSKSNLECPDLADQALLWQDHPSRVVPSSSEAEVPVDSPKQDPQGAFARWAARVQARSLGLPSCPNCGCPTPSGELERWSVCALCAPKQWTG